MANPEKRERNERIYREWKRGVGYKRLAKRYGLDYSTIGHIVRRWRTREQEGLDGG